MGLGKQVIHLRVENHQRAPDHGEGGVGKTRLAAEAAHILRAKGWVFK